MAEIPQNSFKGPLAPKFGLTDNARSSFPIKDPPGPNHRKNIAGLLPIGGIMIALLVLPLTIQQLSNTQDVRQQASQPTPTIVLPTSVTEPSISPTISPTSTSSSELTPQPSSTERRFEL